MLNFTEHFFSVRRLADKSLYSYAHSLLHFVRWEKALPKLKDADRLPDPSTVRRWSSGVSFSQPELGFLRQTVLVIRCVR